jgi:hypothetical protein
MMYENNNSIKTATRLVNFIFTQCQIKKTLAVSL